MNYELAKKLKDGGFPQEVEYGEVYNDKSRGDGTIENGFFIRKPTLSELIEACGDKFHELVREWDGQFTCRTDYMDMQGTYGSTPEEAVANLWLKLNKK